LKVQQPQVKNVFPTKILEDALTDKTSNCIKEKLGINAERSVTNCPIARDLSTSKEVEQPELTVATSQVHACQTMEQTLEDAMPNTINWFSGRKMSHSVPVAQ
jgi:hypothetical protein